MRALDINESAFLRIGHDSRGLIRSWCISSAPYTCNIVHACMMQGEYFKALGIDCQTFDRFMSRFMSALVYADFNTVGNRRATPAAVSQRFDPIPGTEHFFTWLRSHAVCSLGQHMAQNGKTPPQTSKIHSRQRWAKGSDTPGRIALFWASASREHLEVAPCLAPHGRRPFFEEHLAQDPRTVGDFRRSSTEGRPDTREASTSWGVGFSMSPRCRRCWSAMRRT